MFNRALDLPAVVIIDIVTEIIILWQKQLPEVLYEKTFSKKFRNTHTKTPTYLNGCFCNGYSNGCFCND